MPSTAPGVQQTAGYFQYYDSTHQAGLVKGMDINHNQYPVNWTTAYNAGVRFVYLKAGGNGFNFHAARYIRTYCNGSSVDGNNIFVELKAFDTSLVEQAGGKAVTSSVAPTAGVLANFTDGSLATSVTISTGLQWIEVDLGASHNIRYLQLYQTSGRTFFHKKIQYSTDGVNYTTIFDVDTAGTGNYLEPSDGAQIVTADQSTYYSMDVQLLATNISAARAAGIKVGFYWFRGTNYYDVTAQSWHHGTASATTEANNFKSYIDSALGGGDYGDILPVLDFENQFGSINPSFTNSQAYTFISTFKSTFSGATGKPIMIYTAEYTVDTLAVAPNQLISGGNAVGSLMPIWLAATDTGAYPILSYQAFGGFPSNLWSAWQYSSVNGLGATYGVSTADIDLDYVQSLNDILLTVPSVTNAPTFNGLTLYILDGKTESVLAIMNDHHYSSCPFWNAQHFQQINGENTFTFTCAGDHRDAQYIIETNLVGFYDMDNNFQLFEMTKIAEVHAETLEKQVTAELQAIPELNDEVVPFVVYPEKTAAFMLADILSQGVVSRWNVGSVYGTAITTLQIDTASKMEAIYSLTQVFGLEMQFRVVITNGAISTRYVDLLQRVGNDVGKRFVYNKDIVSLEQNIDVTNLKTAMYGYGKSVGTPGTKQYVSFKNVNWSTAAGDPVTKPSGQEFFASSSYKAIYGRANGTRHRFGFYTNSSQTDQFLLLEQTAAALRQNNLPRLEFRMTAVDLEALTGFASEKTRLGDTVRVIDQYIQPAVTYETRVFEITRNYSQPEKTQIVLANLTRRSITQDGSKLSNTKSVVANNQGIWQNNAYQGNLVSDHSFELLETTSSTADADGAYAIKRPLNTNYHTWFWNNTSTPSTKSTNVNPTPRFVSAIFDQTVGNQIRPLQKVLADNQAIVVGTSKRNPRQWCFLHESVGVLGPYSLSAYVASFPGTTISGMARLEAYAIFVTSGGSSQVNLGPLGTADFTLLATSIAWYQWNRFGIPAIRSLPTSTKFIEIRLTQNSANVRMRYLADSIQLTPADFPVAYQPESANWNYQNGTFGYFKRSTYIQAYPSSQQITPAGTSFRLNLRKLSTQYDSAGVTLGSKINDPLREWHSSSQGVFVPRRNGHYEFNCSVRWGQGVTGGLVEHFLEIDGVNRSALSYMHNMPSCSQTNGSAVVYLQENQRTRVVGFASLATTINSSERMTHLRIKRLQL